MTLTKRSERSSRKGYLSCTWLLLAMAGLAACQSYSARWVDPAAPIDDWWSHLSALCGKAFDGRMVSSDPVDAAFAEQTMTMHVRLCEERRLEIPFNVGENRSRTWVLTRSGEGVRLQHDHRHEDGSEDEVTLYGGSSQATDGQATDGAGVDGEGPASQDSGTALARHFPADPYSKRLFEAHGLEVSVENVWTMELVPGERFSYILRRPERHFQVDFDLTHEVEPPPAPWGHP